MAIVNTLIDTFKSNHSTHFTQIPASALSAFNEPAAIVTALIAKRSALAADPTLTPLGKAAARGAAAGKALASIADWKAKALPGLDADVAQQRAALVPSAPVPNDRTKAMADNLRAFGPLDRSTLYGSASDSEKLIMEHASILTGRIPVKTDNGLEWAHLLNPETVQASQDARVAMARPAEVQRLHETETFRDMHENVATTAAGDIHSAVPDYSIAKGGQYATLE